MLLDKRVDLNTRDDYGSTALEWAPEKGYFEIAELLLDKGADINTPGCYGLTALEYASERSLRDCGVAAEQGSPFKHSGSSGRTALDYASMEGHFEIINCCSIREPM